jgi:NADH-quinone oxidoreductase subunit H
MGVITRLLFLGGGNAPFFFLRWLPASFWIGLKATLVVFVYIWVRATLPRFKYSQLMRLGWKRLLPLTLAGFVANAVFVFVSQMISPVFDLWFILFFFIFK